MNLGPSSPNCSKAGGVSTCVLSVNVTPGAYDFGLNAMDGQNGSGKILGTTHVVVTVVSGRNTIHAVLDAVIAYVKVGPVEFPAGKAATIEFPLTAYDADGNAIVGTSPFSTPISLKLSNGGSAFKLSQTTIESSARPAHLTFSGKAPVSNSTIAVSGSFGNVTAFVRVVVNASKEHGFHLTVGRPIVTALGRVWFALDSSSPFGPTDIVSVYKTGTFSIVKSPINNIPTGITGDTHGNLFVSYGYAATLAELSPAGTWKTASQQPGQSALTYAGGYVWGIGEPYGEEILRTDKAGHQDVWKYHTRAGPAAFEALAPAQSGGGLWTIEGRLGALVSVAVDGKAHFFKLPHLPAGLAVTKDSEYVLVFEGVYRYSTAGKLLGKIKMPPVGGASPGSNLIVTSDGTLWFANGISGYGSAGTSAGIVRVPNGGSAEQYNLPAADDDASDTTGITGLALAPDGNLWYEHNGKVGEIFLH